MRRKDATCSITGRRSSFGDGGGLGEVAVEYAAGLLLLLLVRFVFDHRGVVGGAEAADDVAEVCVEDLVEDFIFFVFFFTGVEVLAAGSYPFWG